MGFDMIELNWERDSKDCLVDFIAQVIVIGYGSRRIWDFVKLKSRYLLYQSGIVAVSMDFFWCKWNVYI